MAAGVQPGSRTRDRLRDADRAGGPLRVRAWTSEEFASSREAWNRLLAASDADPLFLSWEWQWHWWARHASSIGASLQLAAVYSGDVLIGIAPFYSRQVLVRGVFRTCRLELIGTGWRDPYASFSDYLEVIAARDHRDAVVASLGDWLDAHPLWQELVVCCTRRSGVAAELVQRHVARFAHVREVDPMSAWSAQLPAQFEEYVRRLEPEVRRKLFNHRRKLPGLSLESASVEDVPGFLADLWRYSAERWGKEGPRPYVRDFDLEMAASLARTGDLRLSRLVMPGSSPCSVMYAVRKGETVYYLQSGFDPRARGVSLGYLHFGFAIEAACREGARRFDLLAGPGRHRDYKQDLLTEKDPVVTYHAARGVLRRLLYAGYEMARHAWSRSESRAESHS